MPTPAHSLSANPRATSKATAKPRSGWLSRFSATRLRAELESPLIVFEAIRRAGPFSSIELAPDSTDRFPILRWTFGTTLATGDNVNRNPLRVDPDYDATDRRIAFAAFEPKSNVDARK